MRHGRSTANSRGILAGRKEGVGLDETGIAQAGDIARRLADIQITHIVTSPLQRTVETAKIIARGQHGAASFKIHEEKKLNECDYGKWSGKKIKHLAKDPLWAVVQAHPSAVTFPGGESMLAASTRAIAACRKWARRAHQDAGDQAVVVIVSHGDIIKSVIADALGSHLDMFQRIVVDPASLSIVNYTPLRPFVELVNDTGLDLAYLNPSQATDAVVGGGAGQSRKKK